MPLCGTHWQTPAASRLRISASSRLCPGCSSEGERNGLKLEVRRAQRWSCSGQGTRTHTLTRARTHKHNHNTNRHTHTHTPQTSYEKNSLSCRATASGFLKGSVAVSFPSNPKKGSAPLPAVSPLLSCSVHGQGPPRHGTRVPGNQAVPVLLQLELCLRFLFF